MLGVVFSRQGPLCERMLCGRVLCVSPHIPAVPGHFLSEWQSWEGARSGRMGGSCWGEGRGQEEGSTGAADWDAGSPELNILMFSLLTPARDFAFSRRAPLAFAAVRVESL